MGFLYWGKSFERFRIQMRCSPRWKAAVPAGQSALRGLYPCGEGAGYAGGIMSAAADGIRIAEQICRNALPENVKKVTDNDKIS